MSDALASDASPASWPEATTGSLRLGCSDTLSQQHRQKQTYNAKPNIGTADTHALLCSLATIIIIIIIISLSLDAQLALTQLNSTENYGRRCLTPLSQHRNYILS